MNYELSERLPKEIKRRLLLDPSDLPRDPTASMIGRERQSHRRQLAMHTNVVRGRQVQQHVEYGVGWRSGATTR
jgi:hypothetical protein